MKKKILLIVMAGLAVGSLTACSKEEASGMVHANEIEEETVVWEESEEVEWIWSENVARHIADDGWVYTFEYRYPKYGTIEGLIPFSFCGVNLRYKYSDEYIEGTIIVSDDPSMSTEILRDEIQLAGNAENPALARDMEKVAEILDYDDISVTREDLLALNPYDYTFEVLDKDMFFSLMREALNGAAHKEGYAAGLMPESVVTEEEYLDDYKFQVGYANSMGVIDIVYIDVLYKTGDRYNDYVQLYDLVKEGKANEEQKAAYELMRSIEKGIVEGNDLSYGYEENANTVIGNINFYRLYQLLNDMYTGKNI